jgi:hypothetical protein
MFNGVKKWNARRWRIAELRKYITGTYESELRGAKSEQERGEAYQIAHSIVQVEENELEYLQQETLQRRLGHSPIEVPNEYWNDKDLWEKPTLTNKGEAWARRELRKIWMADVEFWAKLVATLVLPTVAIVLSIIALVKKSH